MTAEMSEVITIVKPILTIEQFVIGGLLMLIAVTILARVIEQIMN